METVDEKAMERSFAENAAQLPVYHRFKVMCALKKITVRDALERAMKMWIKKHGVKK